MNYTWKQLVKWKTASVTGATVCVCVCVLFSTNSITNFSNGPSLKLEEQQPAELVANAYDNNAEINHTWGTKMSALSGVSTMRFVHRRLILDLVTRGGGCWEGWGRWAKWRAKAAFSSHGNRNVYCQQAKVVVVFAGGGASSACRVGHDSLGGTKPLEIVRVLRA